MFDSASFAGKHVLITGAASGIGRATALEMARRGARLALVDIDSRGGHALARDIGPNAQSYVVDIADADAVEGLAADVQRLQGPVDVLINNAGVAIAAPFARTSVADWEWIVGVNMWGPCVSPVLSSLR